MSWQPCKRHFIFSKAYVSHSAWRPLIKYHRISWQEDSTLALRTPFPGSGKTSCCELSGISFRSGKEICYEYRLKGLDQQLEAYYQYSIEFPALPFEITPLEVRSIDRWGKRSRQSRFDLYPASPPFCRLHGLSYALPPYGIGAGAGVYIYHRNRRAKKEKKTTSLKKKGTDLEMMALRAQMNPHFIFNCLTSIQYQS